jgi:hypothetical protein
MKKINFILVLIMLAGNSLFAQTWDILDKSMGSSWNVDEGSDTNKAWGFTQGGSAAAAATQQDSYVNIKKTVTGTSARYAWVRPAAALAELTAGTAYTIEVKARAKEIDKTEFPDGTYFEASQIGLRIGSENLSAPIFLRYGDGVTGGSVSTVNSGTNAYALNTSEWQVYRIILHADHTKYDVYIDGVEDPIFANIAKGATGDQRGVYFGAESQHRVNLDVEYVKMGTGNFYERYNATLSSLGVSAGTLIPEFSPTVTEYTCDLYFNAGNTVTPSATAAIDGATITGNEAVDVSSGSGTSTITVTALDGTTTKTYTIHYVQTGYNYTSLIVNNDFDYVAEGVLWNDNTNPNYPTFPDGVSTFVSNCFRPVRQNITTIDTHAEFYGWQLSDWSFMFTKEDGTTPAQSIGIGGGNATTHGTSAPWIAGNSTMTLPDDFEFYQTIDKDNISEGTYKVTCILGIADGHLTSQRLFANQNVQFFGKESDYETNKTAGEIYHYAGYTPEGQDTGKGLKVYVTISEGDSLKLGLRGGSYKGDGTLAATNNLPGWFKFDYFTLTKIDPAVATDASLSGITLSVGSLNFLPETYTYNVILPEGTTVVTPTAVSNVPDATVTGTEEVDVTSGSGTSTIVVTAIDGRTQKTYTLNYMFTPPTGIDKAVETKVFCYTDGRKLIVQGAGAYTVYSVSGVKIADVTANPAGTTVDLLPGVYVVKTKTAGAYKVIVK